MRGGSRGRDAEGSETAQVMTTIFATINAAWELRRYKDGSNRLR